MLNKKKKQPTIIKNLHRWLCSVYLAGAGDAWQAVAVSQSKLDFNVNPLSPGPRDPVCPQPVVLTGFEDVTHLVGPDGDVLLIHDAHLLPLRTRIRHHTSTGNILRVH